jgi:streptogramin lyase
MGEAEARAGRAQPALVARGRSVQIAPAGPQARGAQDLAAIVDRTTFARARGAAGGYAPTGDPIALPGRVADLAAQADGTLLALFARDGQLASVATDGKNKTRVAATGASAVAVDRYGRTWIAAPGKLLIGDGGSSIPIPPGAEVVSIAPTGPLSAWIADADERRVVRLNGDGTIAVTAPLPPRADPVRVAAAADGGVWVLELRGPTLLGFGPGGEQRASVALADRVEKPVDVRSDALGNAYLLAAKPVAVYVFDPSGKLALTWEPAVADPGKEFPRPALLAVDGAGQFALYDARLENVRWWR